MLLGDKVAVPLAQPWGRPSLVLTYARRAQLVLPEGRRRLLNTAGAVVRLTPLLVENGVLSKGDALHKGAEKPIDPKEARLNAVADERDAAMALSEELQKKLLAETARANAAEAKLAQVPSEGEVIKRVIADILHRAWPDPLVAVKPGSGEEINRIQAEAAARLPKHDPLAGYKNEPAKPRKPEVLLVVGSEEPVETVRKLQAHVPEIEIREVRAREDGRMSLPKGAAAALLIAGVRHATSAETRDAYPNTPMCTRLDATRLMLGIRDRLKREGQIE